MSKALKYFVDIFMLFETLYHVLLSIYVSIINAFHLLY